MYIRKLLFVFLLCYCQYTGAQGSGDVIVVPPGSTVHLHAASEGAVEYQWFLNGETIEGARQAMYPATRPGHYTVISYNAEGCNSEISGMVEIRFSGTSPPPSGEGEQYFCRFHHPVIADIEVTGTNITWHDAREGGRILPETHPLEDGITYYASQSPEGEGSESPERLPVTVYLDYCPDLSVTKEVDNPEPLADSPVTFVVNVTNETSITVRDISIADRLPSGYTYDTHQENRGIYSPSAGIWEIPFLAGAETATLHIVATVLPHGDYTNIASLESSNPGDTNEANNRAEASVTPSCLTVYNLFSPNNDGINDTFRIDCIENYPGNRLEIYNRYGNLVFRQKGYDNTWQGVANVKHAMSRNSQLPVGTYYYVLDLGDGSKPLRGWLYIMR